MSYAGAGGAVAAAGGMQRRRILEEFRTRKATSPDRAVPESSLEIRAHRMFARMRREGVIVQTPDGRLYLNEAVEAAIRRVRLMTLAAVLLAGLIAFAWIFGMKGKGP